VVNGVTSLQRRIVNGYADTVGLEPQVRYAGGARLRPLPPLDTALNRVMIIGAYPSARFESMAGVRDVPVGDNLGPFEPERYFDGSSVRSQRSADELAKYYLEPLRLDRKEDCWITDLVKVFLFKQGHRAKYEKLGIDVPEGYERERFEELGRASVGMLLDEVELAEPQLVITLGAEVAGILRGVESSKGRNNLLGNPPVEVEVHGHPMTVVHLAHPGIVMRKRSTSNPWPDRHTNEHIPALKPALDRLLGR
jgi:uracil-DNA glycosylase